MVTKALGTASKDGISVDAQIGDRENDVGTQLGGATGTRDIKAKGNAKVTVTNENSDAKIGTAKNVTVQNVPPWIFILAVIGWLLPTPTSIFKGIKSKWLRRTPPQQ